MDKYKCIKEVPCLIGEPMHVGTIWTRKYRFELDVLIGKKVYLIQGNRRVVIVRDSFNMCFEKREGEQN